MDDLHRLLIETACEKLIVGYANTIDLRDWDAFVELFAEDGVWQRPSLEPLVGHADIRQWTREWPIEILMRHIVTNVAIEVVDREHATAFSFCTVYRSTDPSVRPAVLSGPSSVVEYRDKIRLTPGGWRFAYREFEYIFKAA